MKIKHSERGRYKLRTLASLQEDYNKFVQSGYNIKNAKCHNNVTEETMFYVSVDQVFVIPFFFKLKYYQRLSLPIHFTKGEGIGVRFQI